MPAQAEAARATDVFVRAAFSKPYMVGYLRCQYIDRPAGLGRGLRQGLLNAKGKPYELMVNTYRHVFGKVLEVAQRGEILAPENTDSAAWPVFDIWYGDIQHFGNIGHPQRWINILGHVAPGESIKSLTYSLNSGKHQTLSFKEDFKRLARTGDFNVEIDRAALRAGENHLVLRAITRTAHTTEREIRIFYDPSDKKWPLPYKIDWRDVSRIEDVAQVVDGEWKLTDEGLRSIDPYYDRVIAFGDGHWEDYEVMASVIFHGFTPPKASPNTTGVSHAAIALRWPGHDEDEYQPHVKWYPLGATAEFRLSWNLDQCRWRIFDGKREFHVESARRRAIELGRLYHFKHRVRTLDNGQSHYQVKLWPDGGSEPENWDLERYETDDLASGSVLLIAHHTDVTFVTVQVSPIRKQP
jgi:hypothetical protein